MRILIVEDEQRLARLLRRVLQEQGHQVELAFDGETGLELGQSISFDLIVLDLMLPKRDGLDVCRSWRACKARRSSDTFRLESLRAVS